MVKIFTSLICILLIRLRPHHQSFMPGVHWSTNKNRKRCRSKLCHFGTQSVRRRTLPFRQPFGYTNSMGKLWKIMKSEPFSTHVVPNHQQQDCVFNSLFRLLTTKTSKVFITVPLRWELTSDITLKQRELIQMTIFTQKMMQNHITYK